MFLADNDIHIICVVSEIFRVVEQRSAVVTM